MEKKIMTAHISNGNSKADIPAFSLPPIKSCGEYAHCTCGASVDGKRPACYACKAYAAYPSARNAWDENMQLAVQDLPKLKSDLREGIAKLDRKAKKDGKKVWFFRGHVSGDFEPIPNDTAYAHMWADLCREYPAMQWYTYTKSLPVYDRFLAETDQPENMTVMISAWPGIDVVAIINAAFPHIAAMIATGRCHIAYVRDGDPDHDKLIPAKNIFRCHGNGKAGDTEHTCRNCTKKGPMCGLNVSDVVFDIH